MQELQYSFTINHSNFRPGQ